MKPYDDIGAFMLKVLSSWYVLAALGVCLFGVLLFRAILYSGAPRPKADLLALLKRKKAPPPPAPVAKQPEGDIVDEDDEEAEYRRRRRT